MATAQYTHAYGQALHPIGAAQQDFVGGGLPLPAVLLILGLIFMAGFAVGITVESTNLRIRERQLARGRKLLAAQARGLRQQLNEFYRLRDRSAADLSAFQELSALDVEEHGS